MENEVWVGTRNNSLVCDVLPLLQNEFACKDFSEPFILAVQLGKKASSRRCCFFEEIVIDKSDSNFSISQKFASGVGRLRKSIDGKNFNNSTGTYIKNIGDTAIKEFIKALIKILF
ncbi:hypothetical protein [Pseudoalteromonas xiamenensis]|uniref:Uncharacterized protein n=1 Tax=Pseudoalteromonas xiamenensis TaxID=882626 RepID=A0A975DI78_9GAMM|nr:hypothetical protein [Pseudoalteromonas xiamenensis]QTH71617.1 hypothetical protein J5O05_01170 [Pseudoalteromonas xiamenensis]